MPTTAVAGALPSVAAVAQRSKNQHRNAAALHRATVRSALAGQVPKKKLRRHAPPKTHPLVSTGLSLANELSKLPHQVFSVIKKSV